MKKVIAIVMIVGVSYVAGCIAKGRSFSFHIKGNGATKTETRAVAPFTKVDSDGSFEVTIDCQKAQSLEVEADENLLPLIETKVDEDGTLHLDTRKSFSTRRSIKIRIAVPELNEVALSGSGSIHVNDVKSNQFVIDLNGSGMVKAEGTAKSTEITLSGSGNINTTNLTAEAARVDLSGSGNVKVFATQEMDGDVSGSGTIRYSGEPKTIHKNVTGSGKVEKQ